MQSQNTNKEKQISASLEKEYTVEEV